MDKETPIVFTAEDVRLEGLLGRAASEEAVVVAHPHSLYGGDMHNPVVEMVCRSYLESGFSTLRFNFRGVGASEGAFENGCGETRDVMAAIRYLLQSNLSTIHLVGYSFGARVLAGMAELPAEVVSMFYIAPPVALMDFSGVEKNDKLQLVVCGENDTIAPPVAVQKEMMAWNPKAELVVVPGCDHFFSSKLESLQELLDARLRE